MSVDVIGPIESGAAVGADGVATISKTTPVDSIGLLLGVYVEYTGDKPGTTDVLVETLGADPVAPAETLLSLVNKITDGWFHPRLLIDTSLGVEVAGVFDYFAVADKIKVTLSQANTDDSVRVWLRVWKQ